MTGAISSLNLPAFCAASALFCEATANLSCVVAGDLPLARDVLGRGAHVIAVEGVPQAVLDHRVDHLEVAHLHAVAQMLAVRRQRHRFLAAGGDDLGIAIGDLLQAERHRAQARAAELVDAPGRAFDRDAGVDRAWRAGFWPWPAVRIWPRMTSSTSFGSTLARSIAALSATVPRAWAGTLGKRAVERPTGVRAAETMTTEFSELAMK